MGYTKNNIITFSDVGQWQITTLHNCTWKLIFTYHRYRYEKLCRNDPGQIGVCSIKCIQDIMTYIARSRL